MALIAMICWTLPAAASGYSDGFYVGFGVGYGHVIGTDGVAMDSRGGCAPAHQGNVFLYYDPAAGCHYAANSQEFGNVVTTSNGSGVGVELRLGYNILGYASVELSIAGTGTTDFENGIAYPALQVRVHPAQFFIPFEARIWDVNISGGAGYTIAGYTPDPDLAFDDDTKGWEGFVGTFGIGAGISPVSWFSVDFDLRFIFPRYLTWVVNFEDGIRSLPSETPETTVIAPTVQLTFRVPTGE